MHRVFVWVEYECIDENENTIIMLEYYFFFLSILQSIRSAWISFQAHFAHS